MHATLLQLRVVFVCPATIDLTKNNRILKTDCTFPLWILIILPWNFHPIKCIVKTKKIKIGVFHTLPKLPHCCGSCVKVCWKWKRQVENSCQPFSAQTRNFKISKVALAGLNIGFRAKSRKPFSLKLLWEKIILTK